MDDLDEIKVIDALEKRRALLKDSFGLMPEGEMKQLAQELVNRSEGLGADLRASLDKAKQAKASLVEEMSAARKKADQLIQDCREREKALAAKALQAKAPPAPSAEPNLAERLRSEVLQFFEIRFDDNTPRVEDSLNLQGWAFASQSIVHKSMPSSDSQSPHSVENLAASAPANPSPPEHGDLMTWSSWLQRSHSSQPVAAPAKSKDSENIAKLQDDVRRQFEEWKNRE